MAAAKLNANNVVTKEKDKWEVKSEDEKWVYTVQKVNDICPESHCSLKSLLYKYMSSRIFLHMH